MQYSDAVDFLQSFPDMERGTHGARGPTMSLDAMKSLLSRMGDPQNGRRTIHITGSKGKGSTTTMLTAVLKEAGFSTATFTSPHLHSYTERIALNAKPISEQQFADAVEKVMPFVKEEEAAGSNISTFGILTAMFFHIAREAHVDWQVVEVGLGGRYDATNVFDQKDLAIITPISLEHIEVLGTNQGEIANNKAGIITSGCLAVLAPQKDPAVRNVIGRRASEVGADMLYVAKAYKIKPVSVDLTGTSFSMDGLGSNLTMKTPMLGEHQIANAATAVAAAKALAAKGTPISDEQIANGIAKAKIAGRYELVYMHSGDLRIPVILDGAHNHESAAALTAGLKALFPGKRCIFIIGVNRDKNVNAIWRELLPLSRTVIATQSTNLRAMDSHSLADQLSFQSSEHQMHPKSASTVKEAVELARAAATADDVVVVTGSLYVVAEARECLELVTASN